MFYCTEFTMQNVTFSNGKKSWKDAVNHCSVRGGVLESNITLLREQDEFKNVIENDQQMWIGKFKTLTNWTFIRGLFVYLVYLKGVFRKALMRQRTLYENIAHTVSLKDKQIKYETSANNADFIL